MHVYSSHPAGFSNPYPAMADDAAAHEADDGSVESNETAATVDERDLLSDDESGGGAGDDDTPSEDEADEPDGSGGGGPAFRVREVECGESILVIMDISLPPVGRPGGKARLGSFLFLRQCEELLYGSTAGSYTGALHAAVKVTFLRRIIRTTMRPTAILTPPTHADRAWASRVRCASWRRAPPSRLWRRTSGRR